MSFFDARLRLLLKNIFGSAAARGINLLITLMLVPLTVNALNATDYAYLATAISLSMLTAYADLGMGLAVINVIARRKEGSASLRAQRAVSVVWFALVCIAIAGLLLTAVVTVVLNFIHVGDSLRQYNAMLLAVGFVFAGLPSGLVQRILFAEQRNIEANAWATSGKLISLGVVFLLERNDCKELIYFVFAIIGIPALINWASVVFIFLLNKSLLRPSRTLASLKLLKKYASLGTGYLVLNLVPYVETGSDALLLASFGYTQTIQAYDVYAKLFNYIPALVSMAAFPLWPAVANAKASGDSIWIEKLKRISYLSVVLSVTLIAASFVSNGGKIVDAWVGTRLEVDIYIVAALGLFSVMYSVHLVQAIFLNGLGVVKEQVFFYGRYLPILVVMKVVFLTSFGVAWMLWALNLFCIYRLVYFHRKYLIKF